MRVLIDRVSPLPLILAGAVVIGLALLADPISDLVGVANESGFGWKQIAVLGVGMALITAGFAVAAREG
jgi:uncharacterized membrane protein